VAQSNLRANSTFLVCFACAKRAISVFGTNSGQFWETKKFGLPAQIQLLGGNILIEQAELVFSFSENSN